MFPQNFIYYPPMGLNEQKKQIHLTYTSCQNSPGERDNGCLQRSPAEQLRGGRGQAHVGGEEGGRRARHHRAPQPAAARCVDEASTCPL